MTHIVCTPEQASFALASLSDEVRSAAIFMGDGIEIPDAHAELVTAAIATITASVPALSLAVLKNRLLADVNDAAEKERLKYITAGQGQAMTYTEKLAQARALLASDAPDATGYPMIANEVGITAATAAGVAEAIIAAYTAWAAIGAAIEKIRMETNKAITEAVDADAARAIHNTIVWPSAG